MEGMGRLIRLSRNRTTFERQRPANPPNDWDLLPVAVILWIASVARVASGPGPEAFQTEATLALVCVIAIPCWLFWSWASPGVRTPEADRTTHADGRPRHSRVIWLASRQQSNASDALRNRERAFRSKNPNDD